MFERFVKGGFHLVLGNIFELARHLVEEEFETTRRLPATFALRSPRPSVNPDAHLLVILQWATEQVLDSRFDPRVKSRAQLMARSCIALVSPGPELVFQCPSWGRHFLTLPTPAEANAIRAGLLLSPYI